MEPPLTGTAALVTGASSGIGAATARRLAQRGPSSGSGQRRGLVASEQQRRALGYEEMASQRGAYRGTGHGSGTFWQRTGRARR